MPGENSEAQPSTKPQCSNEAASSSQPTTSGSGIFSRMINSLAKIADPRNGVPGDPDGTMIAEYYTRANENDRSTDSR
ncbi:hypothetical protein V865_004321 [Kwoniella europaea PYCC6329]|uniref:Uncharacterized protein n=1 Tax=Kwoniella europaea PYCC6329 TaxID=1423913 RepID=A0AAX4KKU2_9TREE